LKYVTWPGKQRKRPHDIKHGEREKKQPEEGEEVEEGKNRLGGNRRWRIFLQGDNRGENRSGGECMRWHRSRTEARLDRRDVIFNSRNGQRIDGKEMNKREQSRNRDKRKRNMKM
jgi:hypothetical protein